MPFVLTEQLNQDCLKEYFWKHRALHRNTKNPELKKHGFQLNTLRSQRSVVAVPGNTRPAHK